MSSRADDTIAAALRAATELVLDAFRRAPAEAPVVLIDGRSGAGKTTLAEMIGERMPPSRPAAIVALDSLYPGWDGLTAGVETARLRILEPHRRGAPGRWRRWDWTTAQYAEERIVDPSHPLIVEGSGILTARTAELADVRVWLEAPEPSRRQRALRRDGDTYRPHWERWAAQEQHHVDADRPGELADIRIDVP
ncbi:MAG: hypothetical protein QM677_05245 [Microbacterium sp.]